MSIPNLISKNDNVKDCELNTLGLLDHESGKVNLAKPKILKNNILCQITLLYVNKVYLHKHQTTCTHESYGDT